MLGNGLWNDLSLTGATGGDFAIVEINGTGTVCQADVTGYRIIDGNDFITFINSFGIGDPALDSVADVNLITSLMATNLSASGNGGDGINAYAANMVSDSTSRVNGGGGIVGSNSGIAISRCTTANNTAAGITVSGENTVSGPSASYNTSTGNNVIMSIVTNCTAINNTAFGFCLMIALWLRTASPTLIASAAFT